MTQAQQALQAHAKGGVSREEVERWAEVGVDTSENEKGEMELEGEPVRVEIDECEGWVFYLSHADRGEIHVFSAGSSLRRDGGAP